MALALALVVSTSSTVAIPAAAATQDAREYAVKAAFLYGVMKFVEWPAAGLPSGIAPLTVAVLGTDAGAKVKATLEGQVIGGRPIRVRVYTHPKDLEACHVLLIAEEAANGAHVALASVRGRPVLTVTEALTAGAVLNLDVQDTRIAFDADLDAARGQGLRLASNLLRLARKVRGSAY
ncbi:YfiR family protein [Luteitalea sp.]|uniref:YfiR family protein n=1 Tax=Luteitalea sp. TaxID=2004800 RepID=UPI0025C11BD1|nr:YfiR family protein [Luteitalea sp.]